jgi:hypothetical protein
MNPLPPSLAKRLTLAVTVLLGLGSALPAAANDYPTVERVLYVQECMNGSSAPFFEMVNKCSCALDHLAGKLKHQDYIELSTAAKATSIGGERGGYIRDVEALQQDIKRYRGLQAEARAACFLGDPPRR